MDLTLEYEEDDISYIRKTLSNEDLLIQLAEECAELSKAALKLARIRKGHNPTPMTVTEAYDSLIEEMADVTLVMKVLGSGDIADIPKIQQQKLRRWCDRLENWRRREAGNV